MTFLVNQGKFLESKHTAKVHFTAPNEVRVRVSAEHKKAAYPMFIPRHKTTQVSSTTHPTTRSYVQRESVSCSRRLWQRLRLFGIDNGAPRGQYLAVCHDYSLRHLHWRLKRGRVSWLSVESQLSEERLVFVATYIHCAGLYAGKISTGRTKR